MAGYVVSSCFKLLRLYLLATEVKENMENGARSVGESDKIFLGRRS
jgi:hypothetical protein